jgi:hypothetical protein
METKYYVQIGRTPATVDSAVPDEKQMKQIHDRDECALLRLPNTVSPYKSFDSDGATIRRSRGDDGSAQRELFDDTVRRGCAQACAALNTHQRRCR